MTEETASIAPRRIAVGEAELEVFVKLSADPDAPFVCAAHPADAFGAGTAALLSELGNASVVCVNPRGIGGSSPLPAGLEYGLEEMVDEIEAVRRQLGIETWTFWGMSGGGWLGQIYARRHPHALRGLILESVCACFRERLADPECVLSPFNPAWRATLASKGLLEDGSHAEVGAVGETEWFDVEGIGAVFRRRNGPALLVAPMALSPAMLRLMPVLWSTDAREWLGDLRVPTLVLCGTRDPVVPAAHVRAVHEAIAGSELVLVEGAGHVPSVERRAEVTEAVRRFLKRASSRNRA